jgi:hypothetical protein
MMVGTSWIKDQRSCMEVTKKTVAIMPVTVVAGSILISSADSVGNISSTLIASVHSFDSAVGGYQ